MSVAYLKKMSLRKHQNIHTGFGLTIHDLYFTVLVEVFLNHILAEDTYFMNHTERTEHKIMVFKPANKYIQNFLVLS